MTLNQVRSGGTSSRDSVNSSGDPSTKSENRYGQAGSWVREYDNQ